MDEPDGKVYFDKPDVQPHRNMTWGEFKIAVEAMGVTDATQITYIDVNGDSFTVEGEPSSQVQIS